MVAKWKLPSLAVGQRPKPRKELEAERPAVGGMGVAALAVGLPDLDQRVGQHVAFAVEHAALDADVGAGHAGIGDGGPKISRRAERACVRPRCR